MAKNPIKQLENWLVLHIPWIVSGTTYYDISGNGNNGSATSVTKTRTLQQDVMGFNGSSSKIEKTGLSLTFSEITMNIWIKKNRDAANERFLCLTNPSWDWTELSIMSRDNNPWSMWIVGYFGSWSFFWWTLTWIPNGNWFMATLVTGSWFNRMYIDWKLVSLSYSNWSATRWIWTNNFTNLWIWNNWNDAQFASCSLSNARIYNRALTSTEINLIRNSEYIK